MRKRPLLLAASFFLAGISYTASRDIRIFVLLPFFALYVTVPQIKASGEYRIRIRKCCICVGVIIALFVIGMIHMHRQIQFRETYLSNITEEKSTTIFGKISKIEKNKFGYQMVVSDCYLFQNSTYIPCNDVLVYASDSQFHVGEIHKITGKLHKFTTARNEGNFDSAIYYKSQKIDFYLDMQSFEFVADNTNKITEGIYHLKRVIGKVYDSCFSQKHSGVIKGMLLGDKSALEDEIKELFTLAGISHILAISGLHVSVIGRGMYGFLRKMGCNFLCSEILAGSILLLYGILTGNGVSTKRAIGMLLLSMTAQVFGRSYDMLNALGAMCLFLLWENPFFITYSGFWFFVTALFGVGFVGDVFTTEKLFLQEGVRKEKISWWRRILQRLETSLWMSISVTLTTLPMIAYSYFEVSMLSSFINWIFIPLLTPLFLCALFGGIIGIFCLPFAEILLYPCKWILELYEWVCRLNKKLSFFTVITGKPSIEKIVFYYIVLMLGVCLLKYRQELQKQKKREDKNETCQRKEFFNIKWNGNIFIKVGWVVLCFLIVFYQPNRKFEVTVLDVGQGDGIYICDGAGGDFFIDGGSTDEKEVGERRIIPFLKSKGVKTMDYWFVTHADTDHISGLLEVLEKGYSVTYLVFSKVIPRDENYEKLVFMAKEHGTHILYMEAGNYIKTESLQLECLYPKNKEISERNDASLVLELTKESFRALFTGDISSEMEQQLLEQGKLQELSLYKVAHHGSKNSNSGKFLQKILPKIAIISCGEGNSYGHPHKETLERLEAVESMVISTADVGAVTVRMKGKEVVLEVFVREKLVQKDID